ncbi:MAG: hypothetical protein HY318_08250 [Armatimonadetes bacterium]|nr:hypothetical protein [Armatimonadota bacterium]
MFATDGGNLQLVALLVLSKYRVAPLAFQVAEFLGARLFGTLHSGDADFPEQPTQEAITHLLDRWSIANSSLISCPRETEEYIARRIQ